MQQGWESSIQDSVCTEQAKHLNGFEVDELLTLDQIDAPSAASNFSHRSTQSHQTWLPPSAPSRKAAMLDRCVSSNMTLEVAPCVIPEQKITLFKFYIDHAIHDGMTYGNNLYRLAKEFEMSDRLEAYRFGYGLIEQGIVALISVSKQRYRVWINLRNS